MKKRKNMKKHRKNRNNNINITKQSKKELGREKSVEEKATAASKSSLEGKTAGKRRSQRFRVEEERQAEDKTKSSSRKKL